MVDEVVVHISDKYMTLYHLGYLSEDMAKVLVLAHSPHDLSLDRLRPSPPFGQSNSLDMYRSDPRFFEYMHLLRIERVDRGSIELAIAAGSLISSVVIPILLYRAQQQGSEGVTFEVRSSHPMVGVMLNRFQNGEYGSWPSSLHALFADLQRVGVDVSVQDRDVYVLASTVDRYAMRIARVLRMPGR